MLDRGLAAYIAELVGTVFLVFVIGTVVCLYLSTGAASQTDAQIAAFIRHKAETIYHPVGTCRMGTGEDAVVDPLLRVRGVRGLRVVDASVMPKLIGGNTNAPTVMIAEKASAAIIEGA